MQIFFVSIRTALIYGPGELLEARGSASNQMLLRMSWPNDYAFDEWEGYAVVAPEQNEVWGLSHPKQASNGEIEIEFPYTPQAIPPQDRKLFPDPPPEKPEAKPQDEETWSFYQEHEDHSLPYTQQDSYHPDADG